MTLGVLRNCQRRDPTLGKLRTARFPAVCRACEGPISMGDRYYDGGNKLLCFHVGCAQAISKGDKDVTSRPFRSRPLACDCGLGDKKQHYHLGPTDVVTVEVFDFAVSRLEALFDWQYHSASVLPLLFKKAETNEP